MEAHAKRRKAPIVLPTLPPFTGTLEFSRRKQRKQPHVILLPTEKAGCAWAERENVSLLDLEAGKDFERGIPKIPEELVAGLERARKNWGGGNSCTVRTEMEGEKKVRAEKVQAEKMQGEKQVQAEKMMLGEKKMKAPVIMAAEKLVQTVMGSWDASHDPFHALRVRDIALSLACEEGLRVSSFLVVELAALLHDIDDHKYAARGESAGNTVESFLKEHNVDPTTAETVLQIVTTLGFKEELGGAGTGEISLEFALVQDADRLDAIGAIGIARAFSYGGSRNRKMHDPAQPPRTNLTKAEYASDDANPTTINHFAEKLLKLKYLMKTEAGKKRAIQRHEFMLSFLQHFYFEWEGKY